MEGFLDFNLAEIAQVCTSVHSLAERLDPTAIGVWRLQRDTSGTWYLSLHGDGRLYPVEFGAN